MNYKKISFLFSFFLHSLICGVIFLNKGERIKKEDIFLVNLVEFKKEFEKKEIKQKNREEIHERVKMEEEKVEQNNFEDLPLKNLEIENNSYEKKEEKANKKEFWAIDENNEEKISEIKRQSSEIKEGVSHGLLSLYDQGHREKENVGIVELNKFLDPAYFKLIKRKIDEKTFYPEVAIRKNIQGKTKVQFILNKNGELEEVKILKSSGKEILDKTSLEIIEKACPFPEFPDNFTFEKIIFTMEFNFKLK